MNILLVNVPISEHSAIACSFGTDRVDKLKVMMCCDTSVDTSILQGVKNTKNEHRYTGRPGVESTVWIHELWKQSSTFSDTARAAHAGLFKVIHKR